MRRFNRSLITVMGVALSIAPICYGQSLGDIAREQRQKQAAKKADVAPKVITNEDIAGHADTDENASSNPQDGESSTGSPDKKPAEQWKQEIETQKQSVAHLQADIERLNSSIHFAPANCVSNCVQHNEHQVQKQDEVQRMQSELEEQKKKLEDMQEAARKQGYGNSVYEP